jgi:two-component system nitrogen regulation response regulator GlnG
LYYRLNVVPIHLPPLRERNGDIEPLARHFLRRAAREGLPASGLSKQARALLEAQPWRGNVRELRQLHVPRGAALARGEIDAATVRQLLLDGRRSRRRGSVDFRRALRWLAEPRAGPAGLLYHVRWRLSRNRCSSTLCARPGQSTARGAAR